MAPILGISVSEATTAEGFGTEVQQKLVEAFRRCPRFAEGDRKDLEQDFKISPAIFDSEQAYQARVAQLTVSVDTRIRQHTETLGEYNVSKPERQKRMDTLESLEQVRSSLAPPRVDSPKGWEEFKAANPPGTQVLLKKNDVWAVYRTPEDG